jgi:hypothetical protein
MCMHLLLFMNQNVRFSRDDPYAFVVHIHVSHLHRESIHHGIKQIENAHIFSVNVAMPCMYACMYWYDCVWGHKNMTCSRIPLKMELFLSTEKGSYAFFCV